MSADFAPGLEFNRGFYAEAVQPLVGRWPHSAALLGWGSDVLGYDSERSTDHGWGPRALLFTDAELVPVLTEALDELPETYRGRPVRFGWDDEPARSRAEVTTVEDFVRAELGADVDAAGGLSVPDWLCAPQQRLLGLVRGEVYSDTDGRLARLRAMVRWYPHDVWLWLLACQWRRIAQEEAFVGRTAEVGDELGSALVAGRQVRELMRLAFLLEQTYPPYSKWLGTAFGRLDAAAELTPLLTAAQRAGSYPEREQALAAAYEAMARRHNATGLTAPVDPTTRQFFSRPYQVLFADRFVDACLDRLGNSPLRRLPLIGAVDQWTDSTDAIGRLGLVRGVYAGLLADAARSE